MPLPARTNYLIGVGIVSIVVIVLVIVGVIVLGVHLL